MHDIVVHEIIQGINVVVEHIRQHEQVAVLIVDERSIVVHEQVVVAQRV